MVTGNPEHNPKPSTARGFRRHANKGSLERRMAKHMWENKMDDPKRVKAFFMQHERTAPAVA